ncbi:MAG TPA: ATP-binding cassette domain-containing protein, partial [Pirellulaceae bacterium]|nr:ATP-binding cassette domain-containing protein [Pirellulaceae bacterium]
MGRVDSQAKSPTEAAQGIEASESGNASGDALVALDGVRRAFRGSDGREWRALDRVSVRVARGEFLVVTGPSGAGKSTLLSLVGMLDRPSEGRVWFDGRSVERASDRELARLRRDIGFVFQEPA